MQPDELEFERSLERRHVSRSLGLLATGLMMIPFSLLVEAISVTLALEIHGRSFIWGLAPEPIFSSMAAATSVVGLALAAGVLWDLPESRARWALVAVAALATPFHLAVIAWAAVNLFVVVFL